MYVNLVNNQAAGIVGYSSSDQRLTGLRRLRAVLRRGKLCFIDHAIGDLLDVCENLGSSMGGASFQN